MKETNKTTKKSGVKRASGSPERHKVADKESERRSTAGLNEKESEIKQRYEKMRNNISPTIKTVFERWESSEFVPQDFEVPVDGSSLEAQIGYSSLGRQMQEAYLKNVAFYRSKAGGSLSIDEARKMAFHPAKDDEEAQKELNVMFSLPVQCLNFVDLMELYTHAPRVAERFWEEVKKEGKKEFESGHLAANITFPVGYMKQVWNIGRYLGVRESFIAEWQPIGGIEVAMIDMLAQSYFQWQYWLEQTVKRSETREKEEHPEYVEWKRHRKQYSPRSEEFDGHWIRPFVSDVQAIEHAVQMADRFHRIFMRTLRQLRDLRRYSTVTINNPNQVNIAADGGQQANIASHRD